MLQLGLSTADLRALPQTKVATAKKGSSLNILGEVAKPLHMTIGGTTTKFRTRPVVVDNLAMPFNIAGPFLRTNGIDQLHSEDCIKLKGHKVPLLSSTGHTSLPRAQTSAVYCCQEEQVLPFCVAHIQVRCAQVQNKTMTPGGGLLEGGGIFMEKTDLHPWIASIVKCDREGTIIAGVMNTTDETKTIKKGQRYGEFTRLEEGSQDSEEECMYIVNQIKQEPEVEKQPVTQEARRKWIKEQFALEQSPVLKKKQEQELAVELLLKFYDIFSRDGSFGKTSLIQHEIFTEAGPAIKERNRPINPAMEADLKKQLEKWLKHDVVETSHSPWNFALVAAPKKNGSIRWCVDYRRLNKITVKDTYPLPNIEDNLARLAKSKIFSGIDGCGAYHVIEVAKKDRPKTAFATPWGSYQFKRMPFGLTNAPATYCRLVQMVLEGIPYDMALPYLDDTCIHSKDLPGHFRALEKVLQAHRKAGLKLEPAKCQLFRDRIDYLGHTITAEGIRPMTKYVQVVKDWPLPTTKTEARTFLGKVGYYRRFIANYSHLAQPWTDVIGKEDAAAEKKLLEITEAMRKAFQELRGRLLKAPILAYPRFNEKEPFILDTDWSQDSNTIGGVLSQEQGGIERVIAYGAKKLAKSQQRYPPNKGELAAVIHFMRTWKYYLQHRPFVLRTDHESLKWIYTMESPTGMIQRWLDTLANFQFTVVHRAGKKHGNADALSRIAHAEEADPESPEDEAIYSLRHNPLWTVEQLRQAQLEDEDLSVIRRWLLQGQKPDDLTVRAMSPKGKVYAGLFQDLRMDGQGLIRYHDQRGPMGQPRARLCLPPSLWEEAIRRVHEIGGHQAVAATEQRVGRNLFFPHLRREVEDVVTSCRLCAQKQRAQAPQRHTLVSPLEGYPFQRISIDFLGPLRPSRKNNTYVLTVKDTFSKWMEAFPMRHATAEETMRTLEKEIFCRYGIPDVIHSDQGTQFTSNLFKEAGRALGVKVTRTPAYNPQSNQVERSHRDLGAMLRALVGEDQSEWEDVLPQALFAMRTAVNRMTGLAPYQLLFGREASQPLDQAFGPPQAWPEGPLHHQQYVKKLRDRVEAAHAFARAHLSKAVQRQRRQYNLEKKSFAAGCQVWLFTPVAQLGESRKLSTYWTGPWTILRAVNELMYEIMPDPTWVAQKGPLVVSIDRLKLYQAEEGDAPNQPPEDGDDLLMEGDEFAEGVQLPQPPAGGGGGAMGGPGPPPDPDDNPDAGEGLGADDPPSDHDEDGPPGPPGGGGAAGGAAGDDNGGAAGGAATPEYRPSQSESSSERSEMSPSEDDDPVGDPTYQPSPGRRVGGSSDRVLRKRRADSPGLPGPPRRPAPVKGPTWTDARERPEELTRMSQDPASMQRRPLVARTPPGPVRDPGRQAPDNTRNNSPGRRGEGSQGATPKTPSCFLPSRRR